MDEIVKRVFSVALISIGTVTLINSFNRERQGLVKGLNEKNEKLKEAEKKVKQKNDDGQRAPFNFFVGGSQVTEKGFVQGPDGKLKPEGGGSDGDDGKKNGAAGKTGAGARKTTVK